MIARRVPGVVALFVLVAGAAAADPGGAPRKEPLPAAPRRIAVLGLRPVTDRTLTQTAIALLPEAQRLRAAAESVVEVLTGAAVMGHEELRTAAGRTYLVDLFDCRDDAKCQLRIAAPLVRHGVVTAVLGDYWADGAALRFRIRRLDLAGMRVVDEVSFAVDRAAAETLAPWREALRPLFEDTGRLRVVANVPGTTCTLDGHPCDPWPSELLTVTEGEHVLELSLEGYRRGSRVVTVKRGEEQRVAVALEELPVQVQKAPDPSARLPVFVAPTEEVRIAPFGSIRLAVLYDDVNQGEREDVSVPPRGTAREGSVAFFPRPAVIGIGMQAPRAESGWELRGGFGVAFVRGDLAEFDSAFVEVVKPEAGFRTMIGWGPSIVSGLTAGTLTIPEGFGDLNPGMIGVTVSKSFGAMVLEGFVGKHKSMFHAAPVELGATPKPFGAARVAWVDEDHKGWLYGTPYPLTVSISGIYGWERLGLPAEREAVAAVNAGTPPPSPPWTTPAREDLPVWLGSVELFVPLGTRASLAGEGWVGQSVHRFEGALWQVPRLDTVTGRHRALRSAGGWGQVAVSPRPWLELRVVAGTDRVLDGLAFGPSPDGSPAVRENRLAAFNVVWYLLGRLALGAQLHAVQTVYDAPALGEPAVVGAALTSRLTF